MSDHRVQHFRVSKLIFSWVVMGVLIFPVNTLRAEEPLGQRNSSTNKSDLHSLPAQSFAKTTSRLLNTSQYVAETFSKEGISSKSIVAQQQLINGLTKLLEQTDQAPSASDQTAKFQMDESDVGDQGSSNSSQGTKSNSTAGQAPTAELSPKRLIGDLHQRENFADAVWGHLPPRERKDLLRTYSESYLPGYEDRVQRYFEKLAKLRRRQPHKSSEENSPAVQPQP